jgi:NTP pyrophosphatase (non-canonical NTP hydrolase)
MNFKEYQTESRKTAKYPNLNQSIEYPLMGLMGEFGELSEKFKKIMRDNNGVMSQERIDGIKGELGDLMWYLFQIYSEAKIDFEKEYIEKQLFIEQKSSLLNLLVAMNCAISDIAMFCVSKNQVLLSIITDPSNSLISCIKCLCRMCNTTIEEVMDKNIEKLKSRLERNVIKGEGDNR